MEPSRGEDPNLPSSSVEDRLSALPDDVLARILVLLDTTAEAVRTSVLSDRWRRVWTLLPELYFPLGLHHDVTAAVLAASDAALRSLRVLTMEADAETVGAWLPVAAPRLSGRLILLNLQDSNENAEEGGSFELPCFERATALELYLSLVGITLPQAGVFARLTELSLLDCRLHGPCELGDFVSSPRCPSLQKLYISGVRVVNLAIRSQSLIMVSLCNLGGSNGLRQLTINAPALRSFEIRRCFTQSQPAAEILAPRLVMLEWTDQYDPSFVQLRNVAQLEQLRVNHFCVYGPFGTTANHACLMLLKRFRVTRELQISLVFPRHIGADQYLMEDITVLPDLEMLTLSLHNQQHSYGASLFHILRMCTGLKTLKLLHANAAWEVKQKTLVGTCPFGCVCDEPANWKSEELTLKCLEEVVIVDMTGTDHEVAVMKRLFSWAVGLRRIRTVYDLVSIQKANEVYRMLLSLAKPETFVTVETNARS